MKFRYLVVFYFCSIIAVNYEARAAGVKRRGGMRGDDAKRVCPELTLCAVPISEHTEDKADLTRYR
jgi:DNA polymerase eta